MTIQKRAKGKKKRRDGLGVAQSLILGFCTKERSHAAIELMEKYPSLIDYHNHRDASPLSLAHERKLNDILIYVMQKRPELILDPEVREINLEWYDENHKGIIYQHIPNDYIFPSGDNILTYRLKRNQEFRRELTHKLVTHQDKTGMTALHHAILRRRKGMTKKLLEFEGTNLGIQDSNGFTPLMLTARTRQFELFHSILATGRSNPGAINKYGRTTLWFLCDDLSPFVFYEEYHDVIETAVEALLSTGEAKPNLRIPTLDPLSDEFPTGPLTNENSKTLLDIVYNFKHAPIVIRIWNCLLYHSPLLQTPLKIYEKYPEMIPYIDINYLPNLLTDYNEVVEEVSI